jgi:hypothetical protein
MPVIQPFPTPKTQKAGPKGLFSPFGPALKTVSIIPLAV